MFNRNNCELLKEIASKDFTRMYFNDPAWEGGYNFYNRTIYKTALIMLNKEGKTELDVKHYIDTIQKILKTYKTHLQHIKKIQHPYITIWFTNTVEWAISNAVTGQILDSILNEYSNMTRIVIALDFKQIKNSIDTINNLISEFKQNQRKEQLLNEVISMFPMAELINRIVEKNLSIKLKIA